MNPTLHPETIAEAQDMVAASSRLCVRGGGSKPGLSTPSSDATCLDLSRLSGIIEHDPNEFVFTAYAGTPVALVVERLARHGQYLPFEPLLAARGATLGGTVAANSCGSLRYRYGGVRDFVLGARFIDGRGQLVHSGGRVVKNAAGFDLAKFFVGSLGRYGVLVELSFKVFPRPHAHLTLEFIYPSLDEVLRAVWRLAVEPLDIEALDFEPAGKTEFRLLVRLGGLEAGLPDRAARLEEVLQCHRQPLPQQTLLGDREAACWQDLNQLAWVPPGAALIKIPLAPRSVPTLDARLRSAVRRYTLGGGVAWLAADDAESVRAMLTDLGLVGLRMGGAGGDPILGRRRGLVLAERVKRALDPTGKFGAA